MGFREELLEIAGMMKKQASAPSNKIREIAQGISQSKVAGKQEAPAEKIALELVNEMVESGIVKKANFQQVLNNFVEMGAEKLAGLRLLLDSNVRQSLGLTEDTHTKLGGIKTTGVDDSAADQFNSKWGLF